MAAARLSVRNYGLAVASSVIMLLSAAFRLFAYWNFWNGEYDRTFQIFQIVFPLFAAILFAGLIVRPNAFRLKLSAIPVLMGCVFFFVKALSFDSRLHMALCCVLYAVTALLYCLTVFGNIGVSWPLCILFGGALAVHVFQDCYELYGRLQWVVLREYFPEFSVVCILLALFLISLALERGGGRR